MAVTEAAGRTIGETARHRAQQGFQPYRAYPILLQIPSVGNHRAENGRIETEPRTIGERARWRAEQQRYQQPYTDLLLIQDPQPSMVNGRHTVNFIKSEGGTPLSVAEITHRLATEASQPEQRPTESTATEAVDALPRRISMASIDLSLLEPQPTETTGGKLYTPAVLPPRRRRPSDTARTTSPEPVAVPVKDTPSTQPVRARAQPHGVRSIDSRSTPRQRKQRTVALTAASAVLLAGFGLGGFAFLKDKNAPQTSGQKTVELVTSDEAPKAQEPLQIPALQINIPGTISQQDRNGWGHSANLARNALDRDYSLNGTTNILKTIGAYDNLATTPDPDAAKPGDAYISLIAPAIKLIDRLNSQPLGANASADEQAAAQLIRMFNSLDPMETKQVVDLYGNQIAELKQHLTNILNAQQQSLTSYQSPRRTDTAVTAKASSERATTSKQAQEVTVFSRMVNTATSTFSRDAKAKGQKAIAALTSDRQKRQNKPSYAI